MDDLDVFKRTQTRLGGVLPNYKGFVGSSAANFGVALMNLQLQHARRVTRLFDIGNIGEVRQHFLVNGPAEGTLNCSHLIGPAAAVATFTKSFGDICGVNNNNIDLKVMNENCAANGATGFTGGVSYTAKFCVLQQLGLSIDAQNPQPMTQAQLMFTGLNDNTNSTAVA